MRHLDFPMNIVKAAVRPNPDVQEAMEEIIKTLKNIP